jgi:cystathionine beta-lyase/cystathionine gamma-synthase
MSKPAGPNTLCVHAAHSPDTATGALRLSVGIEEPEDLMDDLARALRAVG